MGHPIIPQSSLNFETRIHRAFLAIVKSIERTASLSLDSNPAPNRYSYPAYFFSVAQHPLSRLQQFSERSPEDCPTRGPLASTLLTGVLSRLQNGPALRAGSAVAQRGIFHAEGSFWWYSCKNGFHTCPIRNARHWVGPRLSADFLYGRSCQPWSVRSVHRDTGDQSIAVFSSTSRQSSTFWRLALPASWF